MDKIAMLTEILAEHPTDAFTRYGLAMAYASEGKHDDALREFATTIQHNPDYVPAFQMSAQTLLKLGRTDEARQRLARRPRRRRAHQQRARRQRNAGHARRSGLAHRLRCGMRNFLAVILFSFRAVLCHAQAAESDAVLLSHARAAYDAPLTGTCNPSIAL